MVVNGTFLRVTCLSYLYTHIFICYHEFSFKEEMFLLVLPVIATRILMTIHNLLLIVLFLLVFMTTV